MDQQKTRNFLKQLRKEKNLTQEQLAETLNVSGRTVSRWETGSNMPDLSILVELADYYDVDIREIINGERKSEEMKEEVKETAKSLSDYADAINEKNRKRAVWLSVFALIGLLIFTVIDMLELNTPDSIWETIACMGLGWCCGILILMPFALSGRIGRLKAKIKMRRVAGHFTDKTGN